MTLAHAKANPATHALAHQILTNAPLGQLTLINGAQLQPHGGWAALGTALKEETWNGTAYLLHCQVGGRINLDSDPLGASLHGDAMCEVLDHDTSLKLDLPNYENPDTNWQAVDAKLPATLATFGNPSLTTIARYLAEWGPTEGNNPLLLTHVADARPHQETLQRQNRITDPATRHAAQALTYTWLADDLNQLAAHRHDQKTIIATDHRQPEWDALVQHAALILPPPHPADI